MTTPGHPTLVLAPIRQLLTMDPTRGEGPLGIIREAAVVVSDTTILWVGPYRELPQRMMDSPDLEYLDLAERVVLPGLIDCHTHLVFGGWRDHEFALRVAGATYSEIAAAGGGITFTMQKTRDASFDDLFNTGLDRLGVLLRQGITTCEIKSGYGLRTPDELRLLEVIQALSQSQPVEVVATFLGAHTLPPERQSDRARYIREITHEMLPQVAARGLARFCDVFCERSAFNPEESRTILRAAQDHGLIPRVHAEQLSASGGTALAAEMGAASADHLEYATLEDLRALRDAGTVAVLLPGAAFFLGQSLPSATFFRESGVRVAFASDFNPGSSPTMNLLLVGSMACVRMGFSPEEVLLGLTSHAAAALRMEHSIGRIAPGYRADLAAFEAPGYAFLLYHFGHNFCREVVQGGEVVVP